MRYLIRNTGVAKAARHLSFAFCAIIAAYIVGPSIEMFGKIDALEAQRREERLVQIARDEREIVCLANITYHEARGEIRGFRELAAKVVLAIVGDRTFSPAKTVCELARVPGFFSAIKDVEESHHADKTWAEIYDHMSEVFYGGRTLPRGWGCVRGFRGSDEYLEKLSGKQLAQLGFTIDAKGLKYFAAKMVPVDTRGKITFYSPRGGCSNPTPTT